jgi:hypothetical protein
LKSAGVGARSRRDARRHNAFVVLELTPSESDESVIQHALEDKKKQWSRWKIQGNPRQRRLGPRYLGMLDEFRRILGDAELRAAEAQEARRLDEET